MNETPSPYSISIFLLFFIIGLFFLIAMILLTMRLFERGVPKWLKPVMIILLLLFSVSGIFNIIFFIPWLVLLLVFWNKKM